MNHILPLAALLLSPTLAWSQTYVVDFEDFNTSGALYEDVSETLLLADVGGSGVDVTIEGGEDNRIYDLVQFGGYTFPGPQALIDWNWGTYQNYHGTDIVFSAPVNSMSLIAGDFGIDDDGQIKISAFDAAGTLVDSDSIWWNVNANPPFALLSVSGGGIVRVHYSSGGQRTNSTFFDDITFELDGPILSVSGLAAGGTATLIVNNATPGGAIIMGYSLIGPGPTTVAAGSCSSITALLTQPKVIASGSADASGHYSYSSNVPSSASGVPIWFHAADLTSCQTTNGLAEIIL
jgi:hypothetical protein